MLKRVGENFLHTQDKKLHTSDQVEHEKSRKKMAGEAVSQKPAEKISDWLDVIEKTHMGHEDDPRVLERIKKSYHKKYVIKSDAILNNEKYWDSQRQIIIDEGRAGDFSRGADGKINIPDGIKKQEAENIINNQKQSLDSWLDYLTSDDAKYPTWAKYWAFKSVVKMGRLKKDEEVVETEDGEERVVEKAKFIKRRKDTVASFPILNPRALAATISVMEAKLDEQLKAKKDRVSVENLSDRLNDKEFRQLLSTEDFSKIYSQFLLELPEYSIEGLKQTAGEWRKFERGTDPQELVDSLEGHPLEWCTANYNTAKTQLHGGDFYVYYSYDDQGIATVPRVAIRMEGTDIAEVRGIAPDQGLDPYIGEVVGKKMEEFGEQGKVYEKKSEDVRRLTKIAEKHHLDEVLSREELRFLYEVDDKIQSFGFKSDPRINEIKQERDRRSDLMVIFDATEEEVSDSQEDLNENKKLVMHDVLVDKDTVLSDKLEFIDGSIDIDRDAKNLSRDLAAQLIRIGHVHEVSQGLLNKNFEKFDADIANKMIVAGEIGVIFFRKNALELPLPAETAYLLVNIDPNMAHEVLRRRDWFEEIDDEKIASLLLKHGKVKVLAGDYVLGELEGLDARIAGELIDAGEAKSVVNHLFSFFTLTNETASKLINAGMGGVVAGDLTIFQDLTVETANQLIDAGYKDVVVKNDDLFKGFIDKLDEAEDDSFDDFEKYPLRGPMKGKIK